MNTTSSGTLRAAEPVRALGEPRPPQPTAEFPPEELAHALELLRASESESPAAPPRPEERRTRSGERPIVRPEAHAVVAPVDEVAPAPVVEASPPVVEAAPAVEEASPPVVRDAVVATPVVAEAPLAAVPLRTTLEPPRRSRLGVVLLLVLLAASAAALAVARYVFHQV